MKSTKFLFRMKVSWVNSGEGKSRSISMIFNVESKQREIGIGCQCTLRKSNAGCLNCHSLFCEIVLICTCLVFQTRWLHFALSIPSLVWTVQRYMLFIYRLQINLLFSIEYIIFDLLLLWVDIIQGKNGLKMLFANQHLFHHEFCHFYYQFTKSFSRPFSPLLNEFSNC